MRPLACLILLSLSLCLLCAQEQTTLPDDTLSRQFRIEEVTVSARRSEQPLLPVQRLEGETLERLSAYSVADALRYFSGVQIKDYGGVGGLKTVDIRSMGTNHLGVFYDGVEVGNAQNGTVDLGRFSMDNVEQITLYNGQKTDIFQSAKDYGAAGTLYISTRRPRFEQGKSFNCRVILKAGAFGLANPSVVYEQRLSDNIHLSLNAEYLYAHGRYHFRYRRLLPDGALAWDTVAIRQNGDIGALRAEAGVFGYLPEGKWHLKAYCYASEKGIPGAIVNNIWTHWQRQWDLNTFLQGNFTKTFLRGYDFQINAKYACDRLRYLNPDTTRLYVDNRFTQQEVYLSLANRWALFGPKAFYAGPDDLQWDLSLSADWQWNTLASDLAAFVGPHRNTLLVAAATSFRWKYLQAQASILSTFVADRISHPNPQTPKPYDARNEWTPAIFLTCQPLLAEELYFHAFCKRLFRMPTFNDLYYTDVGNISLLPESAMQYDGGLSYTRTSAGVLQKIAFRADGYFNQISNKIVAVPKGNSQYRWQMMNLGYVEIRGLDANLAFDFLFPHQVSLSLSGSYTFQRAQDFTDPSESTWGGQIAYIPVHSASAIAALQWRGWGMNYSFIFVGSRYHNSANIPENYEPPFHTHDLTLSKTLRFSRWGMDLAVEINNLFNQQYEVVLNYPMPGINGKGIIKFHF